MKKKTLIRLILIMLVCVLAAVGWLMYRGVELTEEREAGESSAAAETVTEGADAFRDSVGDLKMPKNADPATAKAAEHIYSHRGRAGSKEHTFEAYDAAIKAGSVYIEQDLVLSADGTLYVSHDQTPERLTGGGWAFAGMTDAEIDELKTANGEKIHTLREVFEHYGTSVNYVIELKNYDLETIAAFEKLVDEFRYENNIIVQCFELAALEVLDEKYPDMPKLFLVKEQNNINLGIDAPYVDIISVEKDLMTSHNCEFAHNYNKKFSAWTLNTEEEIQEAVDLGVDTFFTDETALAFKILKNNDY